MRQRDIFWFWLPLFASWLLMTAEGPVISAAINRLPNEVVMLAAQGIVVSLSVTIESPIINLLATATALVRDRHSFLLVRRFTIHLIVALTIVTVAIGFTPLFDLVVGKWLGTPPEIAEWVRVGMRIMALWSAAIGWRRFLQGVLIHFGQTRKVAWGTAVRLVVSGGGAVLLAWGTDLPGVVIGTIGLMVGVVAEAIFATVAVQPLLKNELAEDVPASGGKVMSYRELFWFHLPLAGTSVLVLLAQPLVTSTLARLDRPDLTLAAWPLIFQFMLVMRAIALALPEVVIALTRGQESYEPLRRFSFWLGLGSLGLTGLVAFTPLGGFYFLKVQDAELAVGSLARDGVMLFLLLPSLTVLVSWLRGLLIHKRATAVVNAGMVANLSITVVVLGLGLAFQWAGIATSAVALTLSLMAESVYLGWQAQRVLKVRIFSSRLAALAMGTD